MYSQSIEKLFVINALQIKLKTFFIPILATLEGHLFFVVHNLLIKMYS